MYNLTCYVNITYHLPDKQENFVSLRIIPLLHIYIPVTKLGTEAYGCEIKLCHTGY
jgi:hypothetical protein